MLKASALLARIALAVPAALVGACSGVQYFLANAPTVLGSYERTTDLRYGEDVRQRLDLYAPRNAVRRPVVVFWYGGSWTRGRKADYRFVGAALAERGFLVAIADYRLYPQAKFPMFLHDAAHAVTWVQQHAAEFGGDPQRIVLMGHSAGAHMAAFLAFNRAFLAGDGAHPEAIKGLIALSGPYALVPNSDLLHHIFASPYTEADWQPIRFVDASSPAVLLFHGENDRVVEVAHAQRLREKLLSHHIPVEAQILAKLSHASSIAAFALGARHRAPVLEHSVKFIERVCASPVSSAPPASAAPVSAQQPAAAPRVSASTS